MKLVCVTIGSPLKFRSSMYQACVKKVIIVCKNPSKMEKNLLIFFSFMYQAVILAIISMSGIFVDRTWKRKSNKFRMDQPMRFVYDNH